jgi:hypothetical protein
MLIESREVEAALARMEDRVAKMRKRAARTSTPGGPRDPLEMEADGVEWAADLLRKAAAKRPAKLRIVMGGARRAAR